MSYWPEQLLALLAFLDLCAIAILCIQMPNVDQSNKCAAEGGEIHGTINGYECVIRSSSSIKIDVK